MTILLRILIALAIISHYINLCPNRKSFSTQLCAYQIMFASIFAQVYVFLVQKHRNFPYFLKRKEF